MSIWVAVHGIPVDETPEQVLERGRKALAARASEVNHVVTSEPREIANELCKYFDLGNTAGWEPIANLGATAGPPDGRSVVWEADSDVSPEAVEVKGTWDGTGMEFVVPPLQYANGGYVRCFHYFEGPVTTKTYRDDGTEIGHKATTPFDGGELQVLVVEETALIRIQPQ